MAGDGQGRGSRRGGALTPTQLDVKRFNFIQSHKFSSLFICSFFNSSFTGTDVDVEVDETLFQDLEDLDLDEEDLVE